MGAPATEREEVVILRPEVVGEGKGGEDTGKLKLGDVATATGFAVELAEDDDVSPLARAAETLVRQGKRNIVLDLARFPKLRPEAVRALLETHKTCEGAGGRLVLAGLQAEATATIRALELETVLACAADTDGALAQLKGHIERRQQVQVAAEGVDVDVHQLPLGAKRTEPDFVDGYRRLGPDGVTREVVVVSPDRDGLGKLPSALRQLKGKKLKAFVIDLGAVDDIAESTMRDLDGIRAQLQDTGGFLAIANAPPSAKAAMTATGSTIHAFSSQDGAISGFRSWIAGQAGDTKATSATQQQSGAEADVDVEHGDYKLVERSTQEFVFHKKGKKKPGKRAMAATSNLLTMAVAPAALEGLADAVQKECSKGATRILVDLSQIPTPSPQQIDAVLKAKSAAAENKSRLIAVGISESAREDLEMLGLADELETFSGEAQAAAALADEICTRKRKRGIRFRRKHLEIGEAAVKLAAAQAEPKVAAEPGSDEGHGTDRLRGMPDFTESSQVAGDGTDKLSGMPDFTESGQVAGDGTDKLSGMPDFADASAEERLSSTDRITAPDFAREEEAQVDFSDTDRLGTPSFLEDEAAAQAGRDGKPRVTAEFGVPNFDNDEDADDAGQDAASRATAMFGVPDFDDEDEDQGADAAAQRVTAQFAVPNFDDEEGEQAADDAARRVTAQFSVPNFDDEEDEEAGAGAAADRVTAQFAVPDFDDEEDEEAGAGSAAHRVTAQFAAPNFDDEEEEAGAGSAAHRVTAQFAAPTFDDDEEEADHTKTAQITVPDFSADDEEEPAPHETAKISAPDFSADFDEQAAAAGSMTAPFAPAIPPPTPETDLTAPFAPASATQVATPREEHPEAATLDMTRPHTPAPPVPAEDDVRTARTEIMPALTPEQAAETIREQRTELITSPTAEQIGTEGAGDDVRAAKTEIMPGMTPEQARELLASEEGVESSTRLQSMKTESFRAAAPADAVTDAERRAASPEAVGADSAAAAPFSNTHDGRTVAMDGMSREEAMAQAGAASGGRSGAAVSKPSRSRWPVAAAVLVALGLAGWFGVNAMKDRPQAGTETASVETPGPEATTSASAGQADATDPEGATADAGSEATADAAPPREEVVRARLRLAIQDILADE
jgi:anti-anti-sigma regulatory factor